MSTEPREEQQQPDQEERWSSVLQEVHDEFKPNAPWYQQAGVFAAWAGAIGLGAGLLAAVLLLIVSLFSKLQFNVMEISNWLFWTSCVLLFAGLLAPSASDLQETASERQSRSGRRQFTAQRRSSTQRVSSPAKSSDEDQAPALSPEERRMRAIRKRLRRVYNPWRWRLWGAAAISFALTVLIGSFVGV